MYIRGGLIILRSNKADKRLSRLSILSATLSIFLEWVKPKGEKKKKKTSLFGNLFGILHVVCTSGSVGVLCGYPSELDWLWAVARRILDESDGGFF